MEHRISVDFSKNKGKYRVRIRTIGGRNIHVGYYDSESKAYVEGKLFIMRGFVRNEK